MEIYADVPTIGGSAMDRNGNIYFADATHSAISVLTPDRKIRMLVRDKRLIWPDAIFLAPDRHLYIPAAQVNRLPIFKDAPPMEKPFLLFKYPVPADPQALPE